MTACQFCGDDHAATHEVYIGSGIWLPSCEDATGDHAPTHVRPMVFRECSACGRDMERDRPICRPCQRTARNSGGPYDRQRHIEAWRFKRHGMEG